MNLRNVLRAYSNLRQLTDDESALLETLRAMNDSERELLVESLSPDKPASRTRKKAAGKKSARASGMAAAIGSSLQRGRQKINDGACAYVLGDGSVCNTGDNNPIHDETFGYAAYHPFTPAASPASNPSPANGAGGATTANSETGKGAAQAVAGGGNE